MTLEGHKRLYSDSSPAIVFSLVTPDFLGQSFTRITSVAGRLYLHPCLLQLLGEGRQRSPCSSCIMSVHCTNGEVFLSTRGWSWCQSSPQLWLTAQPMACLARTWWSSLCYVLPCPSGGAMFSTALSLSRWKRSRRQRQKSAFIQAGHHLPKCVTCGY